MYAYQKQKFIIHVTMADVSGIFLLSQEQQKVV
jgi:hypothetical protein